MSAIRTTVQNGRIDLAAPREFVDGTEVIVNVNPVFERIGIDESQWRDDPEALADWEAWLKTIEPIHFGQDDTDAMRQFDDGFRRFNLNAVREQMDI